MRKTGGNRRKHPCPDCRVCQWCSDSRCAMCQGWLVVDKLCEREGCCKQGRKKSGVPGNAK
jgi:hypothetical protein